MYRISRGLKWLSLAVLAVCMALVVVTGFQDMHKNIAAVSLSDEKMLSRTAAFKTLRQQLRAMEKAQLNDVSHDVEADAEIRQMARRQLLELCTREEQELTLEGVLELRGFKDPVVTVHDDSVNVLINCEMLTIQESSVILELVCRETGVQSGNVKIIPIN